MLDDYSIFEMQHFVDIKCYDSTRVVLTWPKDCKNDFIHANWVKHKLLSNSFICTQAPQEHTVFDFWRMVWQEKTKLIIMLCKLVEKRRPKCCQYWPGSIGQTMKFDNIVITKLQIEYEDESRTVYHQQWASWPDRSVPKTPLAPFRLLKCARQQKTPVIVHCSAGIGRTGTLILVEMMLRSLYYTLTYTDVILKKGKVPDAKKYLQIIRNQRARAVQTEDQYIYAHYAIIQMLYIKKVFTVHDVAGE
ncbi:unnamed protein product [Thelazia callipaeda]|uniref:Protein-tyrosine phosphatase n=1 Tax=Thelazia callipaeda TaxID=103827 RepID=A0A0N5D2S8_THECL|nr:unnamed protein product [Thelazia callipaeda]